MSMTRRSALLVGVGAASLSRLPGLDDRVLGAETPCPTARGRQQCEKLVGKALCLTDRQSRRLQPSLSPPATIKIPWGGRVALPVSSITEFDASLKKVVLAPLRSFFKVDPTFAYYDDQRFDGGPNAVASTDGSVLFGTRLLRQLLEQEDGDYAVMAACAHEFGHMAQFQGDTNQRIFAMGLPCYCVELHADLLAGFFVRRFKQMFASASFQGIGRAWDKWEKQSCSHGSRAQRIDALEAGYQYGDPNKGRTLTQAINEGVEYLVKHA